MRIISGIVNRIKNKFLPSNEPVNILDLNTRYDLETVEIISRLPHDSNCIDVGAHKGEILKTMLRASPFGKHFAFEPLPRFYEELQKQYGDRCQVFNYALSENNGVTEFNYVVTNPAYSGIKERKYDRPQESITKIEVPLRKLDDIIPIEIPIKFIKIDVEGAEFGVLKGAQEILKKYHPIVVYEQGLGASDIYGTDPGNFYDFMVELGYKLSLMEYYLVKKEPLSREEYCFHFFKGYNFYFIAYK